MKYDAGIEDNENNSASMLLQLVPPGSTVLEFGSANGRMTRYMRENLSCTVYIVEIEEAAYKDAIQYAKDGVMGDILQYEWAEKFRDIAFDVILFADVLEHLTYPQEVLKRAKNLLKPEGSVLISLPNIAHNDILYNLYGNRFTYTPTGLLDDTHLRFFTYSELEPFANHSGFTVVSEKAVIVKTQRTEQRSDSPVADNQLLGMLSARPMGEVYQFILELKTQEYAVAAKLEKHSDLFANVGLWGFEIYHSQGDSFDAEHLIRFVDRCRYGRFSLRITLPAKTVKMRFDPMEDDGCILRGLEIRVNGQQVPIDETNGLYIGDCDVFTGPDPNLFVTLPGWEVLEVTIDGECLYPKSTEFRTLMDAARKIIDRNPRSEYYTRRGFHVHSDHITGRQREIIYRQRSVMRLKNAEIDRLNREIERLKHAETKANEQLSDVMQSKSWKVTKPLRDLNSLLKTKKHG